VPGGVGSHFLQILSADQRFARRRLIVSSALAVVLFGAAYWILPWEGLAFHAGGLLFGVMAGYLIARTRSRDWETSVRQSWGEWMKLSVGCESVPDIHRRVEGRSLRNRAHLHAGALTALWALELILLALAFHETPDATAQALWSVPVLVANGLLMGGMAAYFAKLGRWTADFQKGISELVDSGEIGVWGVL
jgi:peptidoglycan/LPS O-acetylase OafA/YrhL